MIKKLILKNFRNYTEAEICINKPLNVFTGRNGQGKSNLLEAVFFVSMLRSFRTSQIKDLKTIGKDVSYVSAEIERNTWTEFLEIEISDSGKRKLKIDNVPVSRASEFIKRIKAVAFSPDDINIITGVSGLRRRLLDMFISMMEPEYLSALHDYSLALKSRNAVIKSDPAVNVVKAFEPVMASAGSLIVYHRLQYSALLGGEIDNLLKKFFPEEVSFDIQYCNSAGTADYDQYMEIFEKERSRDIRRGYTSFGPQLDDFEFNYNHKLLRNYGSTGQCRLISLCMKMAEVNILSAGKEKSNIVVLVDDVTGELDAVTREMFFKVINQAGQAFFTFTEKPGDSFFKDAAFYEISNGKVI
jgi:DNA replication and repair protein RecF